MRMPFLGISLASDLKTDLARATSYAQILFVSGFLCVVPELLFRWSGGATVVPDLIFSFILNFILCYCGYRILNKTMRSASNPFYTPLIVMSMSLPISVVISIIYLILSFALYDLDVAIQILPFALTNRFPFVLTNSLLFSIIITIYFYFLRNATISGSLISMSKRCLPVAIPVLLSGFVIAQIDIVDVFLMAVSMPTYFNNAVVYQEIPSALAQAILFSIGIVISLYVNTRWSSAASSPIFLTHTLR